MAEKYILTLDQGTTSSRAIIFDHVSSIKAVSQKEFHQIYPQPGYVEHSPEELWQSQLAVIHETLKKGNLQASDIAAIGITNQRETTLIWDRQTGKAIYNAIVWQDRRTADKCAKLRQAGHEEFIKKITGLRLDPYFSATKISWILDHVEGARQKAEAGQLAFGTVDSWLMWNLTKGKCHQVEISNASRTLLLDINTGQWNDELLKIFQIPRQILPEIKSSSEIYAQTEIFSTPIPISGIAGDQQAALFGQRCTQKGMIKNTYGTGCFMLLNTGEKPITSSHNLLTTIAWKIENRISYALEGSVFIAGAVVQWLRDGLKIIPDATSIEPLAASVPDNGGLYLVPAFTGLGAPHWDPYARGILAGITRGTTSGHLARAALEGIAYQVADLLDAMEEDAHLKIKELRTDGAASENRLLMQFQADILEIPILRPREWEITALGAAYLAGLAVGFWKDQAEIDSHWQIAHRYLPQMEPSQVNKLVKTWRNAVERSKKWIEPQENNA